ncbi:MAG: hypothetical protein OEU57_10650 [Desulfuromonadales bacterium]|nr:hypothetical protein [Desulfuromonadales bacterium]
MIKGKQEHRHLFDDRFEPSTELFQGNKLRFALVNIRYCSDVSGDNSVFREDRTGIANNPSYFPLR